MGKKKAVVIGAGILGLATARSLASRGYDVHVYEKHLKSRGASVRNFGMIWPVGQPPGKLYDRAYRSSQIWKEIGSNGKLWYDPVGSIHVAGHADEWQVLNELFEAFIIQGRSVELLSRDQVIARSTLANPETCLGGMFSSDEIIIDPREAIALLPEYLEEKFGIHFNWGTPVTSVNQEIIKTGGRTIHADIIFICTGSDFDTLFPEEYAKYPLTKCKLQMMRIIEEGTPRIGPALCGGLSLIHYKSFMAAASLSKLKRRYHENMPELLKWGIHVMVSQNRLGQLTIGDSHEYGMAPDPFNRQEINDLILEYLKSFAILKNAKLIESWSGVYGKFTSDDSELFCSPEPGVYILNGVGGTGMTMSFGLAEEVIATL